MIPEKFSVSQFNFFPAYLLLWLKLEPYSVPKLLGTPPLAFRTQILRICMYFLKIPYTVWIPNSAPALSLRFYVLFLVLWKGNDWKWHPRFLPELCPWLPCIIIHICCLYELAALHQGLGLQSPRYSAHSCVKTSLWSPHMLWHWQQDLGFQRTNRQTIPLNGRFISLLNLGFKILSMMLLQEAWW